MESPPTDDFIMLKREANNLPSSSFGNNLGNSSKGTINVSSPSSSPSSSKDDSQVIQDEADQGDANTSKQIVLYDPISNGAGAIEPFNPEPISYHRPVRRRSSSSRDLSSVGAFTVQCANCFKWRLIPTKEKYEEIREHILENPFVCETARDWRPDISCEDPADISQDGSRLWAIDKPSIAKPPRGWQRILHIRGEGSTKFADIYYQAPTGKRLRSMVEIQKYLLEHPEYIREGVTLSQFSFQIPRPLQEDYVKKRPARTALNDNSRPTEPGEANPSASAAPDDTEMRLGGPASSPPCLDTPVSDPIQRPAKQARRIPLEHMFNNPVSDEHR